MHLQLYFPFGGKSGFVFFKSNLFEWVVSKSDSFDVQQVNPADPAEFCKNLQNIMFADNQDSSK